MSIRTVTVTASGEQVSLNGIKTIIVTAAALGEQISLNCADIISEINFSFDTKYADWDIISVCLDSDNNLLNITTSDRCFYLYEHGFNSAVTVAVK